MTAGFFPLLRVALLHLGAIFFLILLEVLFVATRILEAETSAIVVFLPFLRVALFVETLFFLATFFDVRPCI